MESSLEWKEPPNPVRYKKSNANWHEIADMLRARPNEWALVAEDVNPSVVTHIRRGRLKAFAPEGKFDASGQGRNERGYTKELYVRFISEAVESGAVPAEVKAESESVETQALNVETSPAFTAPNPRDFLGDLEA